MDNGGRFFLIDRDLSGRKFLNMSLDKIRELQLAFEKKHKNVNNLRIVGNIVFVTAFFSVIALTIYSIFLW